MKRRGMDRKRGTRKQGMGLNRSGHETKRDKGK